MKKFYMFISIAVLILLSIIFLPSCATTVTLYFATEDANEFYLVPENRAIRYSDDLYVETIRQLISGPESEGLYPTIPSHTIVNSVEVSDGFAVVDFDIGIISDFEEIPHSSTTETLAIYSIVDTLTAFKDIERVKITIEGKESGEVDGFYVEDFWGHIGIYEVFERNEEIIKDE